MSRVSQSREFRYAEMLARQKERQREQFNVLRQLKTEAEAEAVRWETEAARWEAGIQRWKAAYEEAESRRLASEAAAAELRKEVAALKDKVEQLEETSAEAVLACGEAQRRSDNASSAAGEVAELNRQKANLEARLGMATRQCDEQKDCVARATEHSHKQAEALKAEKERSEELTAEVMKLRSALGAERAMRRNLGVEFDALASRLEASESAIRPTAPQLPVVTEAEIAREADAAETIYHAHQTMNGRVARIEKLVGDLGELMARQEESKEAGQGGSAMEEAERTVAINFDIADIAHEKDMWEEQLTKSRDIRDTLIELHPLYESVRDAIASLGNAQKLNTPDPGEIQTVWATLVAAVRERTKRTCEAVCVAATYDFGAELVATRDKIAAMIKSGRYK